MDPDLRQKIEQNYGFLVLGIEPITHSKSGLIYRLDTSQGKRILKGHEPAFNRERLALQHDTIRRLRSAGMLMFPEVYPATEAGGQGPDSLEASTLFTHAGNNFGVYEFKEGEFYSWNDEELQDLAVVLARFHQACAEDRNASRHWKGDPSAQLANLAQLKEYLSPAPETGQSREVKVALDRLRLHLADYERLLTEACADQALEATFRDWTMIHGDLHQKNVLFLDHKVNGILDLDSIRPGKRVYDVAFVMGEFTSMYGSEEKNFAFVQHDPEKAALFLRTYQEANPLSGPFLKAIYLMQMGRFIERIAYELKTAAVDEKKDGAITELVNVIERFPGSYQAITDSLGELGK